MTAENGEHQQRDEDNSYDLCPWYLRQLGIPGFEDGTCGFGCYDEPICVTGDWKTTAEREVVRQKMLPHFGGSAS